MPSQETLVMDVADRTPEPQPTLSVDLMRAELITAAKVARWLDVSPRTVWRMVERGRLTPVRLSRGIVLFRKRDVAAILDGE